MSDIDRKGLPGLRVLALEAYYGGSHRSYLDGWIERSRHRWTLHTLPAGKWKWRMRQSAMEFADRIEEDIRTGARWDVLFTSDMTQLAELRGLVGADLPPAVLYFHENQITYPVRFASGRDYHFGLSNLVSALAAREVWFNSEYHRTEMLDAIPAFLRKIPDRRPRDVAGRIRQRSRIESPAIACVDPGEMHSSAGPIRIAWVARWEFDKAPEVFFAALERLLEDGVAFELSLLGERFEREPSIFAEARPRFAPQTVHWGYLDDRAVFEQALRAADVVVSTARHEFFGMAILEAASAGAHPLVPRRLSYPELFASCGDDDPFYAGGASRLAERLAGLARRKAGGENLRGRFIDLAGRHDWSLRAPALDDRLAAVLASPPEPRAAQSETGNAGSGGELQ